MPLIIQQAQAIPNLYPNAPWTPALYKDAKDAIDELQYADLFRGAGQLTAVGKVRVDMQGTFTQTGIVWSNIQAQVNGVRGNSTIACVHVNRTSVNTPDPQNQRGALHKVIDAFKKSLYNNSIYTIAGQAP